MGFEMQDVERKVFYILKILNDAQEALGARVVARHLRDYGLELGERAVRYHLKLMDERGLTQLIGRDGRLITELGIKELRNALVRDKVGFSISRIELLAFHTNFDLDKRTGLVPVNISFFPKEDFKKALQAMKPAFDAGTGVSDLVALATDGEMIGDLTVRPGKVALATICSVILNGTPHHLTRIDRRSIQCTFKEVINCYNIICCIEENDFKDFLSKVAHCVIQIIEDLF